MRSRKVFVTPALFTLLFAATTAALVAFLEIERSRPLHARIAEHNVGSIRVVEKCGFAVSHEEDGESPMDDGVEEVVLKLT